MRYVQRRHTPGRRRHKWACPVCFLFFSRSLSIFLDVCIWIGTRGHGLILFSLHFSWRRAPGRFSRLFVLQTAKRWNWFRVGCRRSCLAGRRLSSRSITVPMTVTLFSLRSLVLIQFIWDRLPPSNWQYTLKQKDQCRSQLSQELLVLCCESDS